MKIANFINTDFKLYANYDNTRSLPHLIDGLKITERKVLYAFVNHIGTGKIVCDKAGMRAADVSKYHHGATSMIGVLVNMNQDFVGSNNLPLFQKHGQFGTRLNHKASSERYISTQLNDTYKKLFDEDDNKILEDQYDEGDKIEPKYYIPKLPLLLINGSKGVGNGYSSTILSYEVNEVKAAVQEVLKYGKVKNQLTPFFNGYDGDICKDHLSRQVIFTGNIKVHNTTTLIIEELPPSMQLDKYKTILNKLIEDKFIKDFDNESTEDAWRFVIDCPRTTTSLTNEELLVKFKLIEKETENLVAWLPNGKIKTFASVEELIETWTGYRLEYYEKRRIDKIARYGVDLEWLVVKRDFITWWNKNAQTLVKLKKDELKIEITKSITTNSDYVDRILSIRISNLSIDAVDELNSEIKKINDNIKLMETTTNMKMMSDELKSLKL